MFDTMLEDNGKAKRKAIKWCTCRMASISLPIGRDEQKPGGAARVRAPPSAQLTRENYTI